MGKKRQNQTSVSGFFNKIPKISFNENEAKPSTSKQMISPNLATKTSPIKTIENFEILGELPANLEEIADEFIALKEKRRSDFGVRNCNN